MTRQMNSWTFQFIPHLQITLKSTVHYPSLCEKRKEQWLISKLMGNVLAFFAKTSVFIKQFTFIGKLLYDRPIPFIKRRYQAEIIEPQVSFEEIDLSLFRSLANSPFLSLKTIQMIRVDLRNKDLYYLIKANCPNLIQVQLDSCRKFTPDGIKYMKKQTEYNLKKLLFEGQVEQNVKKEMIKIDHIKKISFTKSNYYRFQNQAMINKIYMDLLIKSKNLFRGDFAFDYLSNVLINKLINKYR